MEILMEHWLSLGTGAFLLAMILYGHYRGFIRLAVSLAVLILSVVVVRTAMPMVNNHLKNNTENYQSVGNGQLKLTGGTVWSEGDADDSNGNWDISGPAQQRKIIEQLKLPDQMKKALLENNNSEIYGILGVDAFIDYVGAYLAGMVLNLIGCVVLFLLIYIGIRSLIRWVDLIARLPILHGINQIAGAVLGGVHGLLLVWLFFVIIRICEEMPWTQTFLYQIRGSLWLRFLYDNNIFNWVFIRILSVFT